MSLKGPKAISSLGLAKQIVPFKEVVIAAGPGFEKQAGRIVSFVTTTMPELEKIMCGSLPSSKGCAWLDRCLAYHALLPVNWHVLRRGDRVVSLANADKREVSVHEITSNSMQSKFCPLSRVLTLGAPDHDPGKFIFYSTSIDGTMFVIQAHMSWVDKLMRLFSIQVSVISALYHTSPGKPHSHWAVANFWM